MTATTTTVAGVTPEFRDLPGVDGGRYSLASFDRSAILALIFTGNACPTAKAWDSELVKLHGAYVGAGLQMVMVNPNNPYLSPEDTFDRMVKRAAAGGFVFPYLKDETAALARRVGAVCTPQVFVYDAVRRLRYSGRIADSRRPAAVVRYDLKETIDELVHGREVTVAATDPFGCALVF